MSKGFQGKFFVDGKGRLRGAGGVTWWTERFDHTPEPMAVDRARVESRRAANRRARRSRRTNR